MSKFYQERLHPKKSEGMSLDIEEDLVRIDAEIDEVSKKVRPYVGALTASQIIQIDIETHSVRQH